MASLKELNHTFNTLKKDKTILVAPLHWGLGHATRCIPLIHSLLENGYQVVLASDGGALQLLQKEFPDLAAFELPSYKITYPKKAGLFKLKLFLKLPEIQATIKAEKKLIKQWVDAGKIDGIISDNRLGVRNKKVPSVFITHQINVLSGKTSFFSSKMHQKFIKKFDACWIPDVAGPTNLSGKLGHAKFLEFPVTYIGVLSRMQKKELPKKYDILAILSGPEPQRTLLEEKLIHEFTKSNARIYLVRGVVSGKTNTTTSGKLTISNYLQTPALEKAINESKLVISRSGYTTIMDLAAMEKPAFFIPTPGQYEQEYLAKELQKKGVVPSCKQDQFTMKKLKKIPFYSGLKNFENTTNFSQLFSLFEGKGKF